MKNNSKQIFIAALALGSISAIFIYAQAPPPGAAGASGFGGGGGGGRGNAGSGWATFGGDAQRSGWVRTDGQLSIETMQKPGMDLEWSVKVGNGRETLGAGTSANTAQLDPAPGNIYGSGNNVYGWEIDTGTVAWTHHIDAPAGPAATAACPGGMTAGISRAVNLTEAVTGGAPGRAGGGRGGGWRTAVSQPGEGVPESFIAAAGRGGRGGSGGGGGFGGPGGPGGASGGRGVIGASGFAGGGGGFGRGGGPQFVYAVASDGQLHEITQQFGKDHIKPVAFLPANANATHLLSVNRVIYTSTINGCGGVPNGVWAIDLANNNAVTSWKSGGASPVGAVAADTKGTVFVATGDGAGNYSDAVIALDPKTMTVKDWFAMPGASFATGPVIFENGGKEFAAAATKDGRVFVLDTSSLGGSDHKSAAAVSAATTTSKTWSPSALATWEDGSQTRWLLAPAVGAKSGIVAFKVGTGDKPSLTQAWTSSEIASPSAPIVVNGVVFALSNNSGSAPAVLYGIDGSNGKDLWNSGKTLTAGSKTPLWSISSQVYVATTNSMFYAFGFAYDRHQ